MEFELRKHFLLFLGAEIALTAICIWFWTRTFEVVAARLKLWDPPSERKDHGSPILLVGGLSLFFAFVCACIFFISGWGPQLRFLAIVGGAIAAAATGFQDDYLKCRGRDFASTQKLAGQILAALFPVLGGIELKLFGDSTLNFAFSVLWIVALMNAWNFLDNMDGLAAGLAAIAAITFGIIFSLLHDFALAAYCGGLAGFCFGFLPYNFPKPKYFLGDLATAQLGYFFAVIAIAGSYVIRGGPGLLAVTVPVAVLAVPIFDMIQVMVTRIVLRKPVYVGDHNHLSHRLADALGSRKKAVFVCWILAAILGAIAVQVPFVTTTTAQLLIGAQAALFLAVFLWAILRKK